jgi:hypothetical protein
MRTALFWAITQRVLVNPYWRFRTTYRSHPQGNFWLLRTGPNGCTETSAKICHYLPRNSPEERISLLVGVLIVSDNQLTTPTVQRLHCNVGDDMPLRSPRFHNRFQERSPFSCYFLANDSAISSKSWQEGWKNLCLSQVTHRLNIIYRDLPDFSHILIVLYAALHMSFKTERTLHTPSTCHRLNTLHLYL